MTATSYHTTCTPSPDTSSAFLLMDDPEGASAVIATLARRGVAATAVRAGDGPFHLLGPFPKADPGVN